MVLGDALLKCLHRPDHIFTQSNTKLLKAILIINSTLIAPLCYMYMYPRSQADFRQPDKRCFMPLNFIEMVIYGLFGSSLNHLWYDIITF